MRTRILGIDPGYAIVGCGVIEYDGRNFVTLDYGPITTSAGMPFADRLAIIYDGIMELLEKYQPDAMSVEKLYFNTNQKTAIDVAQARWRLRSCFLILTIRRWFRWLRRAG